MGEVIHLTESQILRASQLHEAHREIVVTLRTLSQQFDDEKNPSAKRLSDFYAIARDTLNRANWSDFKAIVRDDDRGRLGPYPDPSSST